MWECPDMHAIVELDRFDESIVAYSLYWDQDQFAQERFKLSARRTTNHWVKEHTTLYKIDTEANYRGYSRFPRWIPILTLDHFLELKMVKDQIEADNLIPRLLKLRAFS